MYVFVAALTYSDFGYIKAFWNREQLSWIAAHISAYEYFVGVTRILVPDTLNLSASFSPSLYYSHLSPVLSFSVFFQALCQQIIPYTFSITEFLSLTART
jgi:hypothetical protein